MAPFPARVGINEQTDAPQSNAKSSDRFGPLEAFFLRKPRGPNQDEHTQVDRVRTQEQSGIAELIQRHSFVQSLEDFRMRRLQSHRDFQLPRNEIAKFKAARANQGGVRFDDYARKAICKPRHIRILSRRNSFGIEKAARVIELQMRTLLAA